MPIWSPDGRRIAFMSSRDNEPGHGNDGDIYAMNADGSGLRSLTRNDGAGWAWFPMWSANGRKIAFNRVQPPPKPPYSKGWKSEVWVMNADGSSQRRLARGFPSAWSPDGQKIAFRTEPANRSEIYVMNADGSGKRNLTRNPANDGSPSWSPDGRRIAFVSNRDGRPEAHVMNADGSSQRSLSLQDS
jgi:Tol biopolymer transport system component